MGEIKSTLELAMERTRNLVPTREEREEMARREDTTRVQAVVRRLLAGEITPRALAEQIARWESERPDFPWRADAADAVARAVVPGENDVAALKALHSLDFPLCDALEELVRDTLNRLGALDREASERLRGALTGGGIRGSAVVPNPGADPLWQQQRAGLIEEFGGRRDHLLA